jgi:hypothetical protein
MMKDGVGVVAVALGLALSVMWTALLLYGSWKAIAHVIR